MSQQDNKLESGYEMTLDDTAPEVVEMVTRPNRKYGNMKILLESGRLLLSLGPDYSLFIPAFTFFAIASFFMTRYVYDTTESVWFRAITTLVCTIQPISYLITAIVDPGIVTESMPEIPNESIEMRDRRTKECKRCKLRVSRQTYHCSECEVCIRDYDHHCPWVSKCIGKYNLTSFYVFLTTTPIFMIYCMVAFFVCATINLTVRPPST